METNYLDWINLALGLCVLFLIIRMKQNEKHLRNENEKLRKQLKS